jgi:hypothetical protein
MAILGKGAFCILQKVLEKLVIKAYIYILFLSSGKSSNCM